MSYRRVVAIVVMTLTVVSRVASGQTSSTQTVGFAQFFETLYGPATRGVQANGGPLMLPGSYGSADALDGLLVAQIVNLPTPSNAGGFAWTYDPALGTWSRATDSFGPQIRERAQTVGRGKLNFGFAYQRFTFDRLDGHAMSIESRGQLEDTVLDLREQVTLSRADISLSTTFVNYGITSRLDIGVFLPVVSVAVDGSLDYTLRRGQNGPVLSQGTNTAAAREQRLGDPVFRGKYNSVRRSTFGLALAVDGRFSTSNQLGARGGRAQIIASGTAAAFNTHMNAGLNLGHCNYEPVSLCAGLGGGFVAGGVDKAVTKRLTLATAVQLQRVNVNILRTSQTIPTDAVGAVNDPGNRPVQRADTVTVAMTGKFNLWGNMLVTFTGLVPANSSGLTDRFTPIIGLDYAW